MPGLKTMGVILGGLVEGGTSRSGRVGLINRVVGTWGGHFICRIRPPPESTWESSVESLHAQIGGGTEGGGCEQERSDHTLLVRVWSWGGRNVLGSGSGEGDAVINRVEVHLSLQGTAGVILRNELCN